MTEDLGRRDLYAHVVDDDDQKKRAVQILVRSLYRELTARGYDDKQILAVAIELIGKVTDRVASEQPKRRRA
jgi:hypothetical protein